MRKIELIGMLVGLLLLAVSCKQQQGNAVGTSEAQTEQESLEAKDMLQGIWIESETEEVAFQVKGDTIYYTDTLSQPAYFRIVGDSLCLGQNRYPIIKQSEHQFWFRNQGGDLMKLIKSESEDDTLAFVRPQPEIVMLKEVLKRDSVVNYDGERYHWYIAINPTRYRVIKTTYNSEGVAVDNVYFDNIIHISLYHGNRCVYSRDFKKQMYEQNVPKEFLDQAVLGNMQYDHTDAKGVHFNATLCIPDEASCYMVETVVAFDGEMTMNLLDY